MNVTLCLVWYDWLDFGVCVFKSRIDFDHNA